MFAARRSTGLPRPYTLRRIRYRRQSFVKMFVNRRISSSPWFSLRNANRHNRKIIRNSIDIDNLERFRRATILRGTNRWFLFRELTSARHFILIAICAGSTIRVRNKCLILNNYKLKALTKGFTIFKRHLDVLSILYLCDVRSIDLLKLNKKIMLLLSDIHWILFLRKLMNDSRATF